VIAEGQPLDPIEVGGRTVAVVAAGTVDALLSRGQPVELEVSVEPGLTLPIHAGDPVGVVEAVAAGESLGTAPALAETTVRPGRPAEDDGSWWERALEAVGRFVRRLIRAVLG
jgi:hypothetical protein